MKELRPVGLAPLQGAFTRFVPDPVAARYALATGYLPALPSAHHVTFFVLSLPFLIISPFPKIDCQQI